MFRILDRYILREVLPPLVLGLLVFTFVLMIPPMMDVAEGLIAKGVPWPTITRIMATLVPQALGITIPMALLIGLLIGLSRQSADREMVVLQACGVSIYRLLRPVAVLAIGAFGATLYTLIVALPDANQAFREITYSILATRAEHEIKPRVFYEDFPGIVLYVRDVPAEGVGWTDVFLADARSEGDPEVFVAERGRMILDRARRRVEVMLESGTSHRVTSNKPDEYVAHRFDRLFVKLDPDSVFPRTGPQRGYPELRIPELQAEVARLRDQGLSPHRPIMEIHKKFSIPFACLVFAVIGLALGVTSRKEGKLASFVLGIGVIFAYYVIMYGAEAMAKGGALSPHLAMWLPNLVLGAGGTGLLIWRSRSAERRIALPLPFVRRAAPGGALAAAPEAPRGWRIALAGRIPIPRLWAPRVNVLDRYVARLYLRVVALAFVGLLGIFYVSTFIDLSDKFWKGQASSGMLLQYFWYATPQFVYYVLPMAALIATLVTVGVLTKTSELTVIKACGISLYRAATPLLLFGGVWSLVLFGLGEGILATANRRAEAIRHVIRGGSPLTFDVLNRKWLVAKNGSIYHYVYLDPRRYELNGLSIYEFDPRRWRLARRTFVAKAGHAEGWRGQKGWVRDFGSDGGAMRFERFAERPLDLEPPSFFVTEQPDAERMTYRQLERYIRELQASGFNVVQLAVALHRKLSFPFVTVIMTLLAVPFAVTTGQRGALYGVGAGLVLAMTYWILFSVSAAIGSAGLLAPLVAAWAPNVVFGAGAAYFLLVART